MYPYKDHLGNIRINYTWDDEANELTVLNEHHYYPFGLEHAAYNTTKREFKRGESNNHPIQIIPVENAGYQYKYQGQERQDELNLNWDSFKYRNYDYAIGRFMSIDPLAEKYAYMSTYQFAGNKPSWSREIEGLESEVDAESQLYYDITKELQASTAEVASYIDKLYVSITNIFSEDTVSNTVGDITTSTSIEHVEKTTAQPNLESFINGIRPSEDGTAIAADIPLVKIESTSTTRVNTKMVSKNNIKGPISVTESLSTTTNISTNETALTGKVVVGVSNKSGSGAGVFVSEQVSANGKSTYKVGIQSVVKQNKNTTIKLEFGISHTIED